MKIEEVTAIEVFMINLREIFFKDIEKKTGWGKEELKNQFNISLSKTLIQTLKESQL